MSIKSDRWIRRMAEQHGMIAPFEPGQVKMREGNRLVSYGTSSYGYDVRCATEFKIFTNINSSVVDPKNFDEKSFVDVQSDVCIIPPNSFALARTVEYFRIPRNVLTVCLGKSTYARCFSGDTRVSLVDGTAPTLEEMANRAESGEMFWGYSVGKYGKIEVANFHAPRFIGRDQLLEIELDNGEKIKATPDHEFMLRDGTMCMAGHLRAGASLMPLYRQISRGYEQVYQPLTGHLDMTHRLADHWNTRMGVYDAGMGEHRHHLDHDRRNNNPWNIVRMNAVEHIRHHNEINYHEDFDSKEHGRAISDALQARLADPIWKEKYVKMQSKRAREFWTLPQYEAQRHLLMSKRKNVSDETRERHSVSMKRYFSSPEARSAHSQNMMKAWSAEGNENRRLAQAEIARNIRLRQDVGAESIRKALDETGSIRGAARLLNCDRAVFRRFPEVLAAFRGQPAHSFPNNHKVVAVRSLPGDHDVYCLTVPEAGNFALDAGIFVHNCGIICNVTPLEPEWEGHVTLEFSNTTPLPAKIYANEGVAQMLFFESDEPCETSYKDRGGKYQGQRGITIPRT
jgi:deoxycytidine triphosphate deaminase